MDTLRLLITVKAYPAIGKKHGEAVCVAGIDLDHPRWIRLFPVPFRDLPFDQRFKKFDIIELRAEKASDPRPESYRPNVDSIAVVGHVPASSPEERRRIVAPLVQRSMCAVRREQRATRMSLAAIGRPHPPPELRIHVDEEAWQPRKQSVVDQPSLLMPGKRGLEKIPYRFLYSYRCAGEPECPGHEQSIVDWEIAEAFRSWRRGHGEAQALNRIRFKWTEQLWSPERETTLFVGNQFKNPDGFLILGVFWPPKPTGGGPRGSVQGELLPPR